MGTRYYKFFAIMRMALNNKQLEFSAPGNKVVNKVLVLLREKGLIAGFSLDFERKDKKSGYWTGYPRYKVFLKYSYVGVPVIKKIDCFKSTKTNFTTVKSQYPLMRYSSFWLVSQRKCGISLLTDFNINNNYKLLAKFKI